MSVIDLGVEKGFFAKNNIELEITSFTGDAKLQQAFASNSIDIGTGSGPAMAFEIKGAPTIAIAAFAGPPGTICVATHAGFADQDRRTISKASAGRSARPARSPNGW